MKSVDQEWIEAHSPIGWSEHCGICGKQPAQVATWYSYWQDERGVRQKTTITGVLCDLHYAKLVHPTEVGTTKRLVHPTEVGTTKRAELAQKLAYAGVVAGFALYLVACFGLMFAIVVMSSGIFAK